MLLHLLKFSFLGKGKRDNSWLELVKIMITKGARKFIVALENFNLGPRVSNQINRLLSQRKATIVLTSSSKLENFQEAESVAVEANKIGPLEAIFFVSLVCTSSSNRNIFLRYENLELFNFFSTYQYLIF